MIATFLPLPSEHTHSRTNQQTRHRRHRLVVRQHRHLSSRTQRITLINNTPALLHLSPYNISHIHPTRSQLPVPKQTRRQLSRTQMPSLPHPNTRLLRQPNRAMQHNQRPRVLIHRRTRPLTIRTSNNSFNTQRRLSTTHHNVQRLTNHSHLSLQRSSIKTRLIRRHTRPNHINRVRRTYLIHRLLNKHANMQINHTRPYTRARRLSNSLLTRLAQTRRRRTNKVYPRQHTRQTVKKRKAYGDTNFDRNLVIPPKKCHVSAFQHHILVWYRCDLRGRRPWGS